jgi:hypothetical protein
MSNIYIKGVDKMKKCAKILTVAIMALLYKVDLAAYEFNLKNDWNLVGTSENIELQAFDKDCITTIWTFDDKWTSYTPNSTNTISSIAGGKGFWVKANSTCSINTDEVVDDSVIQPAEQSDLYTILAGNTYYVTIYDIYGTLESMTFNSDLTMSSYQEMVGGSDSGYDQITSVEGMTMTIVDDEDGVAKLEITNVSDSYIDMSIYDSSDNLLQTGRLFLSEGDARSYYGVPADNTLRSEDLAGKTLYNVWYGYGEDQNGNTIEEDDGRVMEMVFNADGTLTYQGVKNSEGSGSGYWGVVNNKIYMGESYPVSTSSYFLYLSGSTGDCIKTYYVNEEDSDENNIDLFMTSRSTAESLADSLTKTISGCP